jgi:hypothetical protein
MNKTKIIAFSGKKQSGKNTCANFIYSTYLAKLKISRKIKINDFGEIEVSDLLNKAEYAGIFKPEQCPSEDYILQQVMNKVNPYVKMYSFADPLKTDICINILGLTHDQCYGSDKDKNSLTDVQWENRTLTARDVMQIVGTDILRKMKPSVWTDATINKINKDQPELALITDCRFPNEVQCIKENNGVVIRLDRKIYDSDHISENILDEDKYDWSNFDYIINNKYLDIYKQSLEVEAILKEVLS